MDSVGGGKHVFLLTHSQIQLLDGAKLIGKSTLNIHLSKKQVKANVQHRGGFRGMLAGLAAKALPALLGGLATDLELRRKLLVHVEYIRQVMDYTCINPATV